ncbi:MULTISPECIES: hypothetical protein [Microcystis]|nr:MULTISPECIES: hypothetical protein [Microcystis]TRT89897.1 MAG: hypothetical protein EWV66_09330 [Microcystis sp. M_OC_Ca_00000000_C217Col]MBC1192404.1 hypothetical protein [Microcystis aeruginosa BLCC-F108]MBE9073416.1 hypothetical protein [Microcystis sp. LEGE 08355]MCA2589267.1 hypothetical protein [Microcystis sp. M31BS1]MDB9407191.1 hypothetical protein [Microcystis aeruginosa CS-558/01A06]
MGIGLLTQSIDNQFYPDWDFFATPVRKNFSSVTFSRLSDNFSVLWPLNRQIALFCPINRDLFGLVDYFK